jgi:hypothetical protein
MVVESRSDEGDIGLLKSVKASVHRMVNHLQLISGHLEMEDYTKALAKTRVAVKNYTSWLKA